MSSCVAITQRVKVFLSLFLLSETLHLITYHRNKAWDYDSLAGLHQPTQCYIDTNQKTV
jgi:hypothetical protein